MSDQPKTRKRKLLREYNIPPYKVPDDWKPTSEFVKQLDKMLEGLHRLPEAWRKRWWEEFLEEQGKDDSKGQRAVGNCNPPKQLIENKLDEKDNQISRKEIDMNDQPKTRKRKLLREYNIPPYKVPDDWEPTSETVKKLDEMLEGFKRIPEAWRKRWWKEYLEEESKND